MISAKPKTLDPSSDRRIFVIYGNSIQRIQNTFSILSSRPISSHSRKRSSWNYWISCTTPCESISRCIEITSPPRARRSWWTWRARSIFSRVSHSSVWKFWNCPARRGRAPWLRIAWRRVFDRPTSSCSRIATTSTTGNSKWIRTRRRGTPRITALVWNRWISGINWSRWSFRWSRRIKTATHPSSTNSPRNWTSVNCRRPLCGPCSRWTWNTRWRSTSSTDCANLRPIWTSISRSNGCIRITWRMCRHTKALCLSTLRGSSRL